MSCTIFEVSDIYHDSTLGIIIDIMIVRIIYIERFEDQIALSSNADWSLASFCEWQQTLNPRDTGSPIHHDVAVLLTRYNFKNVKFMYNMFLLADMIYAALKLAICWV